MTKEQGEGNGDDETMYHDHDFEGFAFLQKTNYALYKTSR